MTEMMTSYFMNAHIQRECENMRFEYERKIKEDQLTMEREKREEWKWKRFVSRANEDKRSKN